jgi:polysaccharide pyruvyl transferase WcaK-like protein
MKAVLVSTSFQIGHHGCTLVDRQLERLSAQAGIDIITKLPIHADWSKFAPPHFDAVIVNGEGSLHHDSKAAKRIADVPRWAHARRKPAFLINSVYESNSADIAAKVAEYEAVFVRDGSSQAALAEAGIAASVVSDLTLSWQPPVIAAQGLRIVVTDSTLPRTNANLYAFARSINARYLPLMARPPRPIVDEYASVSRWRRYAIKRLAARVAPPGLWRNRWRGLVPEFDDFISLLSKNAGLIIAGRFHGLCIALDLEIPVLAVLSNTWKIQGVLRQAGLEARLIDNLDELRRQLATDGMQRFFYTPSEIQRIRHLRERTAIDALKMFRTIRDRAVATPERKVVG